METLDSMKARHSTRAFTDEEVDEDQIAKILEAADTAPIGMGANDTVHLSVVRNPEVLNKVRTAGDRDPMYGAPVLIMVSAKLDGKNNDIEIANCACVVENMLLEATDLGLENIYLWGFIHFMLQSNDALQKELGVPEGFTPISAAAIGHGEVIPAVGGHKGLEKTFVD